MTPRRLAGFSHPPLPIPADAPAERRPRRAPGTTFARSFGVLLALLALLALGLGPTAQAQPAEPVVVRVMFGNTGSLALQQRVARMFMDENPDIRVELLEGPEQTDDLLGFYLEVLEDESSLLDVIQLDVIWPGFIAPFMTDLAPYVDAATLDAHIPTIVENFTVDGKLVGVPWFTDVGVLYYRQDLLDKYGFEAPPESWEELEQQARTIQQGERDAGNADFWGLVFQGNAYEGLTVDALEWVASFGGGTIVDEEGNVTIDSDEAAAAIARAGSWMNDIVPSAVTGFNEEASRNFWQAGNAAFMRNWPYAYARANEAGSPVAGKVGVTRLPTGPAGRSAAVLGGWGLGVPRFSEHPDEAARVVAFFTSEPIQKLRAVEASFTPTISALLDDPEVRDANPFYDIVGIREILADAVRRPASQTGDDYFDVSRAFYRAVHAVLEGRAEAGPTLEVLALDLQELLAPDP